MPHTTTAIDLDFVIGDTTMIGEIIIDVEVLKDDVVDLTIQSIESLELFVDGDPDSVDLDRVSIEWLSSVMSRDIEKHYCEGTLFAWLLDEIDRQKRGGIDEVIHEAYNPVHAVTPRERAAQRMIHEFMDQLDAGKRSA